MDLNSEDVPISQVSCNENDELFRFPSSYMSNVAHFNQQIPINYSNQATTQNQFQMNYGFHPTNFTNHMGHQVSYQNLMTAPHLSFDSQISISSKEKGKKSKNILNTKNKESNQSHLNRRHWTREEDVALTKAYLHISIDSIIGTDQSSDSMWKPIYEAWKDFLGNDFVEDRPINGLSKRWCTIQAAVNKFHGIYEYCERCVKSGSNLDDVKRKAHATFIQTSEDKKPFLFEHCWVECIQNAKWCTQQLTTKTSKRQKSNDGSSTNSTTTSAISNEGKPIELDTLTEEVKDADGISRPPGRTTSKEKKKNQWQDKGVTDVLYKLQVSLQQQFDHNEKDLELKKETMKKELEIKEKELAMKEKVQRRREQQKLLNQDLSKVSPMVRTAMEKIQEKILKEWEEEKYF